MKNISENPLSVSSRARTVLTRAADRAGVSLGEPTLWAVMPLSVWVFRFCPSLLTGESMASRLAPFVIANNSWRESQLSASRSTTS